jgi:hypothetical protein
MMRETPKIPEAKERVGGWEVVEKFGSPKNTEIGNEDGMFIGKNVVFVCDGVTTRSKEKIDGLSPGQFAVHAAIEGLKKPEMENITSDTFVSYLTQHVAEALDKARAESKSIPGHPSFVFIAFFPDENRMVRIPDCKYLIDGQGHNPGFAADIRKRQIQDRVMKSRAAKSLPAEADELKQKLRGWQWEHRNNPGESKYNYAVIDGSPVPPNLVEFIDVSADAEEIVFSSDGLPGDTLAPTLLETNTRYRNQMRTDPNFEVDDIIYVRLRRVR